MVSSLVSMIIAFLRSFCSYLLSYFIDRHCVKRVRVRSYSGPHFPHLDWIRRDTPYLSLFSPNVEKCGPE